MNETQLAITWFILGIATPITIGMIGTLVVVELRNYIHKQIAQSEKEMRQYVRDYNE